MRILPSLTEWSLHVKSGLPACSYIPVSFSSGCAASPFMAFHSKHIDLQLSMYVMNYNNRSTRSARDPPPPPFPVGKKAVCLEMASKRGNQLPNIQSFRNKLDVQVVYDDRLDVDTVCSWPIADGDRGLCTCFPDHCKASCIRWTKVRRKVED